MPHQWPFRCHVSYTYCQMRSTRLPDKLLNALPLDLFLLLLHQELVLRLSQMYRPASLFQHGIQSNHLCHQKLQDQKLEDPFRSELDSRQMPKQHIQLHYPQTEDQFCQVSDQCRLRTDQHKSKENDTLEGTSFRTHCINRWLIDMLSAVCINFFCIKWTW